MEKYPAKHIDTADQRRRRRTVVVLTGSALLGASAVIAALTPKLPPFQGD
jgi:hypothetical protein